MRPLESMLPRFRPLTFALLVGFAGLLGIAGCGGQSSTTDRSPGNGGAPGQGGQGPGEGGASTGSDERVVVSISVNPDESDLFVGTTRTFAVTATFDDGTYKDLTEGLTWSTDSATVATITEEGVLRGLAPGSVVVEVSTATHTATATVDVHDPAMMVSLTAAPATLALQTATIADVELTATAGLADGSSMDVTDLVTWEVSDPSQLALSPANELLGLAPGELILEASLGSLEAAIDVRLFGASLVSFGFDRPAYPLQRVAGYSTEYRVQATYSSGATLDLTEFSPGELDDASSIVAAQGTLEVASVPDDAVTTALLTATLGAESATADVTVATKRLFVASTQANSLQAFSLLPAPDGDVAPLQNLSGGATGLDTPEGVFFDPVHDELWVGSQSSDLVAVFSGARTTTGDVAPARSFALPASPRDVAYDSIRDVLYVTISEGASSRLAIFEDPRSIDGATPTPARTITGLGSSVYGLTLDADDDRVFFVDSANAAIYAIDGASTADGDLATLSSRRFAAGISAPRGITLDTHRQRLYAVSDSGGGVSVYADADTADDPAERTAVLSGANAGFQSDCDGIVYDPETDELYVSSVGAEASAILVFGDASSLAGTVDVAPVRRIEGPSTSLGGPGGLFIGW